MPYYHIFYLPIICRTLYFFVYRRTGFVAPLAYTLPFLPYLLPYILLLIESLSIPPYTLRFLLSPTALFCSLGGSIVEFCSCHSFICLFYYIHIYKNTGLYIHGIRHLLPFMQFLQNNFPVYFTTYLLYAWVVVPLLLHYMGTCMPAACLHLPFVSG